MHIYAMKRRLSVHTDAVSRRLHTDVVRRFIANPHKPFLLELVLQNGKEPLYD